jgi:hypothetical protein
MKKEGERVGRIECCQNTRCRCDTSATRMPIVMNHASITGQDARKVPLR